jgi:ABC-type nitrate/sulfonate/bicarbonate transport system permease component
VAQEGDGSTCYHHPHDVSSASTSCSLGWLPSLAHIVLEVIVPAATSGILTGVHMAIPYALIGAVIAELIASNRGIGYLIEAEATTFDTAGTFAALLALSIIAGALNMIVHVIDQNTSRWKAGMTWKREMTP